MKRSEAIQLNGGNAEFPAYLSYPEDTKTKAPGIIVIHEVWGLNPNTKGIADRFAAEGWLAIAPDLLTGEVTEFMDPAIFREMQDPATKDEAQKKMRTALAPTQTPEFAAKTVAKLAACFTALRNHPRSDGTAGVVGFCFGGTYAFALAGAEPALSFAIPFYGHPPAEDVIRKIKCPVLAFYGDKDDRLMATLPELSSNMKKRGVNFRSIVYPDAGHAFFNDQNLTMYNPDAATKAWVEVKRFLGARDKR